MWLEDEEGVFVDAVVAAQKLKARVIQAPEEESEFVDTVVFMLQD